MTPTSSFLRQFCLSALGCLCLLLAPAFASNEIVLHDFGNNPDGSEPAAAMVFDKSGTLYGTTLEGGSDLAGTIFEISPKGTNGWTYQVIYTFVGCNPGCYPQGPLTIDENGNLYGATSTGGTNNTGIIFELSHQPGGMWSISTLYSFGSITSGDGNSPNGVVYHKGALVGTTFFAGKYQCGTVFALTPNNNGAWSETVLHSFIDNNIDGCGPVGEVAFDKEENICGMTSTGGPGFAGTVFELSRNANGKWGESILHNFSGSDGSMPWYGATLIFDEAGNLYGTTAGGGSGQYGTVFELSRTGNTWKETVLHNFSGGADGASPNAGVAMDSQGRLYGTTIEGGGRGNCTVPPPPQNLYCGTVFLLTPSSSGEWNETFLHRFSNLADGGQPAAAVILDPSDNVYGVASSGGNQPLADGVAFRLNHVQ